MTTVDVHIHCSDLRDDLLIPYAKLNGLEYNLKELLRLMEEHDVASGLLLSSAVRGNAPVPNPRILDLCGRSRDRLFPVLTVEPGRESVREAVGLAKRNAGYVKGFKVRLGYVEVFAYDRVFDPLYEYAESQGLPVMFHTGDTAVSTGSLAHSHPLTLDPLANRRQELKIVACHFGNPWIQDVAELIYKHRNVYADISGLFVGGSRYLDRYLESLAERLSDAIYFAGGAEKVMFGTDYPIETYAGALALARRLRISGSDLEKVLSANARKVFDL